MTREEALDTMGATLDDWIDKKNMHMLIDKIYDNFEEAMKPKMCKRCKQSWEPNGQTFHRFFCEYLKIPVHGDFCCNRYEPKDNA